MPGKGEELERLFITLLADDSGLKKSFERIVTQAKATAGEVSKAFAAGAGKAFVDSGAKVEASARKQAKAVDKTKLAFESLRNESAGLRNAVEGGLTTQDAAIKRFLELQTAAGKAAVGFAADSKEYRQFTQVAAQASRSVATLEGRVSKLGFSANAAVGITGAISKNMGLLGPAGYKASQGLGIAQMALGGFVRSGPGVKGALDAMIGGFSRLNVILPIIAAGATVAAIMALTKLGNAAAEAADKIDKGSKSAGLSAEAYQELAFAFEQNGIAAAQFDMAIQSLSKRLGQAAAGNVTYTKAYTKLGIAIRDAEGNVRDSESIIVDAIDAISRLPSAAEQAGVAAVIFGDDVGKKLVPALQGGKAGIDALRESARDMGLIISGKAVTSLVEYKDAMNVLTKQFATARIELTAAFIPILTDTLIPLLQNTVIPTIQRTVGKVADLAQSFMDQGPAGVQFRADMLKNIEPLLRFADTVVGIGEGFSSFVQLVLGGTAGLGAALGEMSVQLQAVIQQLAGVGQGLQWWQQGNIFGAVEIFKRLKDIGSTAFDPAERQHAFKTASDPYFDRALKQADEAQAHLKRALDPAGYQGLLDGLSSSIASAVGDGAHSLAGLGDAATDAATAIAGLASAPEGSLAALNQQLAGARKDFENATTEEARAGANERIAITQAEIDRITAIYAEADPFAAAKKWVARLSAEVTEGMKTSADAFKLVSPRLEELRVEATAALKNFGFDSTEYQDAIGKLQVLQAFVDKLGTTPLIIKPVVDMVDTVVLNKPAATVEISAAFTASASIRQYLNEASDATEAFKENWDAFVAGMAATTPGLAASFRAQAGAASDFVAILQAMAAAGEDVTQYQEAIRNTPAFQAGLIMGFPGGGPGMPGASTEDVTGKLQAANARLQQAQEDVQTAMTVEAGRQAAARVKIAQKEVDDIKRAYEGVPLGDVGAFAYVGDPVQLITPNVVASQIGSLRALNDEVVKQQEILQTSLTTEARRGAQARIDAAQKEIRDIKRAYEGVSLTGLGAFVVMSDAVTIPKNLPFADDRLARVLVAVKPALAGAAAAAAVFGTENKLAAVNVNILESAITSMLAIDPAANISELVSDWERWNAELEAGNKASAHAKEVQDGLAAAQKQLAQLTGTAPSQWDNLAAAFTAADAAGLDLGDTLEHILELIHGLEAVDNATEAVKKMREAMTGGLGDIGIGVAIGQQVVDALNAIQSGDVKEFGASLGAAVGDAVGAALEVPGVGQAFSAAFGLMDQLAGALNDLFSGDSPARRKLAADLTSTVAGAFHTGIIDGMKGGDDWQANLHAGVQDAVLGALIDSFIQAAVMQAIFAPFIAEFTKILQGQGVDAAFAYFDKNFEDTFDKALAVTDGFVDKLAARFKDVGKLDVVDPLQTDYFSLPIASGGIMAAPAWALDLSSAATSISEAGRVMLTAANMMHDTFANGIPVTTSTGRGVDAQRIA